MGNCYGGAAQRGAAQRGARESNRQVLTTTASPLFLFVPPTWECPICYEGKSVLCLPFHCSHLLCKECVVRMTAVAAVAAKIRCPLCRAALVQAWVRNSKVSTAQWNGKTVLGVLEHPISSS